MNASSNAIRPAMTPDGSAQDEARLLSRIVLLNVKYSPNLGDGLLSECLERELARALPDCEVTSIDLAGRTGYPSGYGRTRGTALALLERLPAGCAAAPRGRCCALSSRYACGGITAPGSRAPKR